jgi:ATP-binding cassette, subfamily B, multidrug efflux pump
VLIRLLREYLRPYRTPIVVILILQLVAVIMNLFLPTLNGWIIDKGVAQGNTTYILHTGGWMLGFSLLNIITTVIAVYTGSRVAMGFGRDLRKVVFHKVGDFSAKELNTFGAPSLITRSTNDVQQVQMLVFMSATMMVAAPIMCIGGIFMAVREDAGLSWLLAVAVPLLAGCVALIIWRMVPNFQKMQKRIDEVNRVLREQITGVRVIRAFVRERYERSRFAVANDSLTETGLNTGRLMVMIFPIVMMVFNISSIAVLWFGAIRVNSGNLEVGQLTAFLSYLIQILMSVMMATFMFMMAPRAAVSAGRIGEVLDTEVSVVPPAHPRSAVDERGVVRLEDASFAYPGADEPVLKNVSFTARPGTVTAIIGSTGAGKTTLLSLIARLFDVTGGAVTIDDVDVRELSPDHLWGRIGLVPQKPYLFSGTVASNLRYGRPEASDEEMWEALRIAQARDFVGEMPEQLENPIAQGGTTVSGGQRQRLCIARALVAKPDIYLFDDSFSALDLSTDARLRAALKPQTRAATVIVVAQRVSSIIDADQIIILDDGVVVGHGTHEELLAGNETYAEIVSSQLSERQAA